MLVAWHDNGKGVILPLSQWSASPLATASIGCCDGWAPVALTVQLSGRVGSIGSVLLMQDTLPWKAWIGAVLVSSAVLLVARQSAEPNRSDTGKSPVIHGLLLSLMAVISGLAGAFLARHVLLETSLSPLQTAAVRLLGGWLVLMPVLRKTPGTQQNRGWGSWCRIAATVLGTNVGIALQQLVFHELRWVQGGLMATAPVMALLIALEGDAIQPLGGQQPCLPLPVSQ